MKRVCTSSVLVTTFLLLFGAGLFTGLLAWSAPGHRIVAALAWSLLTPKAQEEAKKLLYGKTFVSVAAWADVVRPYRRETASFHHVDIPLEARDYNPDRDNARGPSLIAAIEDFRKVLATPSAPDLDRQEALKFLIHLVGDVHQPLHCSNNHDAGGNRKFFSFYGKQMNLHHFWDYEIVHESGLNELQWVKKLEERLKREHRADLEKGTVTDWALESHQEAADFAYAFSPGNVVDDAYVQKNAPLVETKLLKASVRLAKILNEIWR